MLRLNLSSYGLPQLLIWPAGIVAAVVAITLLGPRLVGWRVVLAVDGLLVVLLGWVLWFFRDPPRACPDDPTILLAPADGRIVDIGLTSDNELGPKVLRIGIFMSIFDVHVNRSPCRARVLQVRYQPGRFMNALNPASSTVNQSNTIWLQRLDHPQDRLIVRQIAGAIARRIVCGLDQGQVLAPGQRIGMIKFGSRTELYVPYRPGLECMAKVGQAVKAGLTPLMRYEDEQGPSQA
ncbi:MAG: phosphatidylserine decarboxylase [Sedimentisphaerales bacterium]|jgi:phosphatidylserine decarboxylase|nr:phosphatidylserine decarboxylase [Sedimentisphaerales bacterium]